MEKRKREATTARRHEGTEGNADRKGGATTDNGQLTTDKAQSQIRRVEGVGEVDAALDLVGLGPAAGAGVFAGLHGAGAA